MSTYIKLEIAETSRDCPGDEDSYYVYDIIEKFNTMDELKDYLIDRYDRIPNGRRKVYQDLPDGSYHETGFLHSYWNPPGCRGDKSVFMTDWIMVSDVTETPRLLHADRT